MINVAVWCPLPLVLKVVKRAKELGAQEERWPYEISQYRTIQPNRHPMQFLFADWDKSNAFTSEIGAMIGQWERENEPEEEL